MNFDREFDLIRNFVFKPCSKDFHARDCNMVSGYFPLRKVPTEGAPSLRLLQGWRRCCRRNSCPFYTARCVCRRRTRPFRLREERGTRICGGFCSLKAGPPAPPTLRFPERTRVALCSDVAHDNHQNSNFLFRGLAQLCHHHLTEAAPAFLRLESWAPPAFGGWPSFAVTI